MLVSKKPVIAVCAVRTGCGKSQTTRYLSRFFRDEGYRVAAIRHPMPYGDLRRQAVQRFAGPADLDAADCTIEEREEYEPYIATGAVIYAGVDYQAILTAAEEEAEIILWDGGNNDFSFIRPDVTVTLVDALRPDHLTTHHPGETCLRLADIVVIAKSGAAASEVVAGLERRLGELLPGRTVLRGASPVRLDDPGCLEGKRLLIVEDGPTITHGGMPWGAGYAATRDITGVTIVDPRPSAAPVLARTFERFPHIGPVLPAMGYGAEQIAELAASIDAAEADFVVAATPIDLGRLITVNKPIVRVGYDYADVGEPRLCDLVAERLAKRL
jgi:predicted GTPase